ncbi:MAG: acyl-CoA/acyl-ACP dehydrogenase [Cellvibrionales bacterium]|nr:acyl-CoA/acyl-ACP dehydrogenase [Cellvibrionales bacterium]
MDFELSEQQKTFIQASLDFATKAIEPGAAQRISNQTFDRALWKLASEFGFSGLPIPDNYGGSGLSALDTMLMFEALGKGSSDMGFAFSLAAHTFATAVPLWRFGETHLLDHYLPKIASGDLIAANAVTETTAGSDIYQMKSKAEKVDGGYKINGQKCFITNAPAADIFLIYAKTDPNQSFFGVSSFLVEKETPGLSVSKSCEKHCLPTSTWGNVFMDDVFVPETQRVGFEGAGGAMFHDSMIWEKGCLFAIYVGAIERMLDKAIEQAKTREQFGQPIGHNQSISNKIIDIKARLECAKLMLYRSGWLYDQGKDAECQIALSKLLISEFAVQSSLDLIQIFGGSAIDPEMGILQNLLDALPSRIFSGTNEIQREIIARKLGLRK